ncbi:MAG: porin [Deltaproteobacteria bacterium]
MKRGIVVMTGLLALAVAGQNVQAKTLEEVLKEKGVITEADYNDILKSAPKTKPFDYKLGKGFTFTSPDEKFQLSVGGNMQLLYTYTQKDGVGTENSSDWRIRRVKTSFGGYAFSKDLTYKVLLNWSELGGSTNSTKVLEEAYLNYKIIDEAQILVGEDKVQYGRQEITSSGAQQFVDRSFVVNAFKPSYDIGVNVHGDIMKGLFKYDAEWVGGKGQNTTSTNNNNAYNLRLAVNPLGDMKYSEADIEMSAKPLLGIGGSYYHNTLRLTSTADTSAPPKISNAFESNNDSYAGSSGWLGKNSKVFQLAPAAGKSAYQNVNINTFETDMAFKWMGLSAQAEYFWAEGVGQTNNATVISNGFYAQLGYMVLPKQLELAVRYAWMDYNWATPNDNQTEVQGAISWYIQGHNLKIQADVTKQHIQQNSVVAGLNTNNPLDNTIFRVQTQLNF